MGDLLTFGLLSLSSLLVVVNPLSATLVFVSLTRDVPPGDRRLVAREACLYALGILLVFTILGGYILRLFGISLEAFRIAGGILLFGIGMEMVYARMSRTKLTATEKYDRAAIEDLAVMPLATPMITGPGAITTAIVLMNEAAGIGAAAVTAVLSSAVFSILVTYLMMHNADTIVKKVGQREFRAVNRLMGMLLIAIAVQFVITGIRDAFPSLAGGV